MSDGLTVKERMALFQKNNNKDSKPTDAVKPVGKLNISSFGNSNNNNNKGNEVRSPSNTNNNSSNSIADRIAAMKVSSSEPMNTDKGSNISPDTTKKVNIADKIAALKAKSAADSVASPSVSKPATVKESPPAVINSAEVTMSSDSEKVENLSSTEQGTDGNARRLSIAERIAAMKSQNKSEEPPKSVMTAHSSSNNAEIATSPNDRASAAPGATQNVTPTENRKGSIADKIAALKASSATKGGPPIGTMSPGTAPPASKATKRLSNERAAFGAGLNMAMLMPGMTPPSMVKRPAGGEDDDDMSRDSESDSTTSSRRSSTEIKHMSLGRPSVASVRKTRGRNNSYVKSIRMSTTDFAAEDGVDIKDIIATTTSVNADNEMVIDEEQATEDNNGDVPMEE